MGDGLVFVNLQMMARQLLQVVQINLWFRSGLRICPGIGALSGTLLVCLGSAGASVAMLGSAVRFATRVLPHRSVEVAHQLAWAPGQGQVGLGYAQHQVLWMVALAFAIDAQIVVRTLEAFVAEACDAFVARVAYDVKRSGGYWKRAI